MTGMYVRVLHHGEWLNREIESLTDEQFAALAAEQPQKGWVWAKALARWIDDHVTDYVDDDALDSPGDE